MKIRKLGKIIFFAVTIVVFLSGTFFTIMNRCNFEKDITDRVNILGVAGGFFLSVGELAFVFVHGMLDARDLWRRIVAYVLALVLIGTISYATYCEAKAYMEDRGTEVKKTLVTQVTQENNKLAKNSKDRRQAMKSNESLGNEVMKEIKTQSFVPFTVNFITGLFTIITLTLIQPREPWKRRRGNVMTPEIRARAQQKVGFVPDGAKAYDDGKGSSVIIKNGREYLTTIPKGDL